MKNTKLQRIIFTVILSVCLIVPLTNDIFISAIPDMKNFFIGANISFVLSISLLGLAVAQLFYGPLLDRFGRKPVLLGGLLLYILASTAVMTANSFALLLIGRFFQAIGACSAITSSLAIARDTCKQEELLSATSLIMAIMGVGPAMAPLIGSVLNYLWGWRASFQFLFFLGCFYSVWVWFFLKESHIEKNMSALSFKKIFGNYVLLAKQSSFLTYCATSGFSYGILFSYIGLSSFFIIEQMHFSLISFGVIVAINSLAIIMTAIFTPKLATKFSFQLIIQLGLVIIFSSGIIMWLLNDFYAVNIYTFIFPIFLTIIGIGMIRPVTSAGAMQQVQKNITGSAASFFNLFSFTSGTVAIFITTKLIHYVANFGVFIAIMGGAALLMLTLSLRKQALININHF